MLPFFSSSFSPTSTPSTTFHLFLSAGTFQPVRSLPLNIGWRSSFASAASPNRANDRTSNSATRIRFIAPPKLFTFDFVIRISRINRGHFPRRWIAAVNIDAIFERDRLIRLERVLLEHESIGPALAVIANVRVGGAAVAGRL